MNGSEYLDFLNRHLQDVNAWPEDDVALADQIEAILADYGIPSDEFAVHSLEVARSAGAQLAITLREGRTDDFITLTAGIWSSGVHLGLAFARAEASR